MSERQERPPQLGGGDVVVVLDGERHVLKPSIGAFQIISRTYGGLMPAMQKVEQMDFDAIVFVIAAGLGLPPNKASALADKVYKTGIGGGTPEGPRVGCMQYILHLMNGGRAVTEDDEVEARQDSEDPSQKRTASR
ncbi:MAG: hypothetical protein Q7T33_02645 [Dehalococcoidia bacterium]|nr:hypothetical protein [Dehalococcoidia bacterium]